MIGKLAARIPLRLDAHQACQPTAGFLSSAGSSRNQHASRQRSGARATPPLSILGIERDSARAVARERRVQASCRGGASLQSRGCRGTVLPVAKWLCEALSPLSGGRREGHEAYPPFADLRR